MYPDFQRPFSMIVAGPSGCGKTTFVCDLLTSIGTPDDGQKIFWCYAESNSKPSAVCKLPGIQFHSGVPEFIFNDENIDGCILVLDDLMDETGNDNRVSELFTRGSHHRNISVILITQNIFHKGSRMRDISLNAKYLVIFKNPRDKAQFNHLARQVYTENSRELTSVYKSATSKPHSYLLIDLTQNINDLLRFRSDIFDPYGCTCFCSKKDLSNIINATEGTGESLEGEQIYTINTFNG